MMMLIFSGLSMLEVQKEERILVNGRILKFNYPGVVAYHYRYKGVVENHNTLRYHGRTKSQFGLESKWGTTSWPILVILFFIACTEVNVYLTMKCFLKTDDNFTNFRKIG